jgi:hypothetical protein
VTTTAVARMGVTWLAPTSVEPRYFVNRVELRERFLSVLGERLARQGTYTICVTGMRGVGKSIFSRWCVQEFARAHRSEVVDVHVDLRMVGTTEFLREFTRSLAAETRAALERTKTNTPESIELRRWLDEVSFLSRNETVTENELHSITTQRGAAAGIKAGLIGVLDVNNNFSWQQSQQAGGGVTRMFKVTPDLLHHALRQVLEHITKWTRFVVVVLFDDLDQIRTDDLKAAVRNVLDINHCVRVVHLRTEALLGDIVREMDLPLEVPALECDSLREMIDERLKDATDADRALYSQPDVRAALSALCGATGNPLVLLRWLSAFAFHNAFLGDTFARWAAPETLERVVRQSIVGAPRLPLLKKLAEAQDHVSEIEPGVYDPAAFEQFLPEGLRKEALRVELVGYIDRENRDAGYWIDGRLALLRPSVARKLREGA